LAATETARVEAFSDGVFAIAITLLVLPLTEIEFTGDDPVVVLRTQIGPFIAFVVSFAVIGRYWISHHDDVRMMVGVDRTTLVLNLLFLFFVVVLPFPTAVLGEAEGPAPTVLYATTIILTALTSLLLWRHAVRAGFTVAGSARYSAQKTAGTVAVVAGFLPAYPLAFTAPGWAQWSWLLVVPFSVIGDRWVARRLAALPPGGGPAT